MKRGKVAEREGIQRLDGEVIKTLEKDGFKYLGVLEFGRIMEDYFRRLRLVLKSKLSGRNKIIAISIWVVASSRYETGIMKWTTELTSLDRKTRKVLTMHGAFHPKSDIDRLQLHRQLGGRGLISCKGCVRAEENSLGWYLKDSVGPLLEKVKEANTETEQSKEKTAYKKEISDYFENEWKNKKMYGQFKRDMGEKIDKKGSWNWLRKSAFKPDTEALIFTAQEQALRTKYVKFHINKTLDSPLSRLFGEKGEKGEKGEAVSHILSECKKLAQKEYQHRHVNVARIVRWELSRACVKMMRWLTANSKLCKTKFFFEFINFIKKC